MTTHLAQTAARMAAYAALSALPLVAGVLIYEPFDYAEGASLHQCGTWFYSGLTPLHIVSNVSLAVAGLAPPEGRSVWLQNNNGRVSTVTIITNAVMAIGAGQSAYDVFASFALRVDAPVDDAAISNIFGFSQSEYNVCMIRPHGVDAGAFDLGIARRWYGSSTLEPVWADNGGAGFATGAVHFIVMRIDLDTTSTTAANAFHLWANPPAASFGSNAPPPATAVTASNNSQSNRVSSLRFYAGINSANSIFFDEFRYGTNWADVTPAAGSSVPRPVNAAPVDYALTSLTPTLYSSEYLGLPPNTHSVSVFSVRSLLSSAQWTFAIGPETNFTVPAGVLAQSTFYAWRVEYIGAQGASLPSFETVFQTAHTAAPLALAYDGAGYAPAATLDSLNGGGGWASPWQPSLLIGATSTIGVVAQGLEYTDLIVTGGAFAIHGATNQTRASRALAIGDGMAHLLTTNMMFGRAGSTNWVAFLAACGEDYHNGSYAVELYENTARRVYIGKSMDLPRWWLSGPGAAGGSHETAYSPNTMLLVARLTASDYDTSNGTLRLWANPPVSPAPPPDFTAVISLDYVRPYAFNRIALYGDAYRASVDDPYPPIPSGVIDELRLGEDWLNVIEIPEPYGFIIVLACAAAMRIALTQAALA